MCGRYALFRWTAELTAVPGFPADQQPHWNLLPATRVPMLRETAAGQRVDLARWGLTPAWLTDLSRTPAHARLETVAQQPMFREAFSKRRCLLPANGFFEWRGVRKRPYWLSVAEPLLYFAAIWEAYPAGDAEYLSVAMLTREAGAQRRPIVLAAAEQQAWLAADTSSAALLQLLQDARPALFERALAGIVNDPRVDGPECLTPA
ncbi:SOS response-associated peptidase [Pseudomonas sp. N040]|uniref:SOS response-associated peptidase n=1 Tax=Pseudomonas sp. N040 TaxID=2785325 RepID=UPI0018A2FF41|nr:SOS response-associated peptidase [Pseudomonas sp. N040]MBF7730381.1 SOS response-associated peptidase [Pseudomonas sp. N040]MBW7014023.1 SOS response-associated peptidase [Pseudomonas sp. N040]